MKQLFPFSINDPLPPVKQIQEVTSYGFINTDGQDVIDLGLGSSGCFPLGFKRTDLLDAVTAQMKQYPFCQSDFVTANHATIELSNALYTLSGGYYPMYSLSGSDAVEGAIKLAKIYNPKRKTILGFTDSYHGSTFMSASVSGSTYLTDTFGRHPDCRTIDQLTEINEDTLAVIIETCSWQAGLVDRGAAFWKELRNRCTYYGALLIVDDIAFCAGKTGTLFGFQVYDIEPDIFCIGKGITGGYFPLSATLCNKRVADVVKPQTLLHGFSYSFPMAGIISVLEYLRILQQERVLENHSTVVTQANELFTALRSQGAIKDFKSFGVCYKLELNNEIPDYLEKERLFYKHGLHMGLWNNDKTGILIMLPLDAGSSYFSSLKDKLISVTQDSK